MILLYLAFFIRFRITERVTLPYKFFLVKISQIIIKLVLMMYFPYLSYANTCLAPSSFQRQNTAVSDEIRNKIDNLNIVKYSDIENFIHSHPEFQNSYYDELNPIYPKGCEQFSYFLSEALEKEGIEHVIIQTRAHYYILFLAEFPGGIIKDVVLDYTADQVIGKKVSPLLETREKLGILYPESYKNYWQPLKVITKEDISFDYSYLFLIEISILIDHYQRNVFEISS